MLRFAYDTAHTLDDAVALLTRLGPGARLLAGGTDLLPQIIDRAVQ